MAVSSHLPLHIVETILLKLSVKPLHRFKSVSKSWNIMISDPIFVENHTRRSKKHSNLFLRPTRSSSSTGFSLVKKSEGEKFQTLEEIEAPFGCGRVLCFCDCMLLLTDSGYSTLVLWNPSTRTATQLWHRCCCSDASFGLCRDPNTDDFKVVVADLEHYSVYSCKNKSWITMKKEYEIQYAGFCLMESAGVCVDGASYWVYSLRDVGNGILYYDPRDDKFKFVHKPEKAGDNKWIDLVNLRGSLCLYYYEVNKVQIWTKENGVDNSSWKELVTVECDTVSIGWRPLSLEPLYFVENKILFRIAYDGLVIYSPSEKRFEEFEEDKGIGVVLVPYLESLYYPIEKPKSNNKRKLKCLHG